MRVGTVCYATEQGLGHLAKWFYDAGVITDVLLVRHSRHPSRPEWYPPGTPFVNPNRIAGPEVDRFLSTVDVVLFWETPYDWQFPSRCRAVNVKTAICVMYEWFPADPPCTFDRIIAPSLLDRDYFPGSAFLPVPAPPVRWQERSHALRFLHNAGHVGHRGHKGTAELLQAVRHVRAPFGLTVRCQYPEEVGRMREMCGNDDRVSFVGGTVPYGELFDGFDVYVAPEKFNGLSLPLAEAHAAGLLVMTTNRYPANTWLPKEPLIPVNSLSRARISGRCLEFDEALVRPEDIAWTIDQWHGRDVSYFSRAGKVWAEEHSWQQLKPRWLEALSA